MTDRRKKIPAYEIDDFDEVDDTRFEKIPKATKPLLPSGNRSKARRSSKETLASKKVRKSVSSKGGMHRRRQRKVQ